MKLGTGIYTMGERSHKLAHGFTLIELLVVIAIIGMLIALVMPGLESARRSARGVACLSNLRQMGLVAYAWSADHGGYLPAARIRYPAESPPAVTGRGWWHVKLQDYIPDRTLTECPEGQRWDSPQQLGEGASSATHGVYALNRWFRSDGRSSSWDRTQRHVSRIVDPANRLYLGDVISPWPYFAQWDAVKPSYASGRRLFSHRDGYANFLFAAGNAAAIYWDRPDFTGAAARSGPIWLNTIDPYDGPHASPLH